MAMVMELKMQNIKKVIMLTLVVLTVWLPSSQAMMAEHDHQAMMAAQEKLAAANSANKGEKCQSAEVKCAKTVTSAFAPNGDLWRLWTYQQKLFVQISPDNGATFSTRRALAIPAEKISARNENRPKIAFDHFNGVYLSWATPKQKKYTADVRFSYSNDYGKTFAKPITVNNDNLLAGHSFNELHVTDNGDVSIVWLDGRFSHKLRQQGEKSNGSALFLAQANFRAEKSDIPNTFTNQLLSNGTCVCCRIAIDVNQQGELAILWRHIYGDNIREFALLTVNQGESKQQQPYQISHDHWKINGCPHQGGAISIDENNRYHMVWFNQGDLGKGIFYASSDDQGKTLTKPTAVGLLSAQASHPHLNQNGKNIDIVWTQFTGIEHQLWHQRSTDNGKSFAPAVLLAKAENGADRPFIIKKRGKSYVSWQRPKQGHWLKAL
jgi:hypothetical protein